MPLYKGKYRIESSRLPGWNYSSPGYYFITVCTHDRGCLFGHVTNEKMYLNDFGRIVQNEWDTSFVIRRELLPDEPHSERIPRSSAPGLASEYYIFLSLGKEGFLAALLRGPSIRGDAESFSRNCAGG
jgi:hypothetical protein